MKLTRKCKICKTEFVKKSPLHSLCSGACAIVHLNAQNAKKRAINEKKERANTRVRKEQLKSVTDVLREAQRHCNRYVRLRDYNLPCISCGKFHTGQYHAGHYRTTKAAPHLRFNLDNIHKQCSVCNNHLSGNITEYFINLVKKIGIERVEDLENNHEMHRYTMDEAQSFLKQFRQLCRTLEQQQKEASCL